MTTDARTASRSYPKPHTDNTLSADMTRLIQALEAIGVDVAGLLTDVAGRALATHSHAISDVTGLQTALDGKRAASWVPSLDDLSDVAVSGAANGQFLRLVSGSWQPATLSVEWTNISGKPSSYPSAWADVTGKPTTFAPSTHSHAISEVTSLQSTLTSLQNGVDSKITKDSAGNQIGVGWSVNKATFRVDASNFGTTWPIDISGAAASAAVATTAGTATYLSGTQQTAVILGARQNMVMAVNDGSSGSLRVESTGTVAGDSALAGISFHCPNYYAMKIGLRSDGYFGVGGWSSPAWRWYSDPSGNMVASGNVTAYSDERKKKDWKDLPPDFLEQLAEVRMGTYTRIDADDMRQVGVSAQSLQRVMPEAVVVGEDGDYLTVSYGNAALAAAVYLAREVVALRREVAELRGAQT